MGTPLSILAGLALAYTMLLIALLLVRPRQGMLREALRLLPDLLRLVRRLAADRGLPRGPRVGLWLLLAYLALPFDVVPDFVPVLGYADDAILVSLVLRWVLRRAGPQVIRRHWPGTEDGLRLLAKLVGHRVSVAA